VSARINRVANDDEECSEPVELAQIPKQAPLLKRIVRVFGNASGR
jgi:hypothetical protein